jgi:hypothetical protein
VLQLDDLCACSTPKDIETTLYSLPDDLDETYRRIIQKIDKRDRSYVKGFIRWLAFSLRAMRPEEIAATAAVDLTPSTGPVYDSGRQYDPDDVLKKCSSLVTESDGASLPLLTYHH